MSVDTTESKPELSYFEQRMNLLGITPDINKVAIMRYDAERKENILVDIPIFKEVEQGIDIIVYTLDRETISIEKNGSRLKKQYSMVRLKNPIIKGNDSIKYLIPKGAGTYPFFPPSIISKYENKEHIDTLFLVEGFFKAFKASMHGADIVGLSSITHMKDKEKGSLHPDIIRLMGRCSVKRMVWLTDGDALDITNKELTDGMDLYKRPNGFFQSVATFKRLLDDYDVEKWFIHIDIDEIRSRDAAITRDEVKGIDDLLVRLPEKAQEIITDMGSVSSSSGYFQKFAITYGLNKVYQHFHLRDVKEFYLFHVERRPELKEKEFIFNGTLYVFDEKDKECRIVTHKEAKLYFRVGDHYYKFIAVPNQFNKTETQFHERKKATIVDDYGKTFPKSIPKYEAFCNVPNHLNYQPVIDNCFNVYSPPEYQPDDEECYLEDCPAIMGLLHHIFGHKEVSYYDKELNKTKTYNMIDLALDYMQLLYQRPQQKLPILCLVSKENGTGKTTFANLLRQMLGANVAIVGNQDLSGDFNAHWATKSVVVCDETKIDKVHVIEKIKSLSTARKIFMNAKGRGQVELDCFIKFILLTNNEDNFISVTDDDIRYWVLKVPQLKNDNPNVVDQFIEEMPAFLSVLNRRVLKTEQKNRMWFHPMLLKTDAFRKVVAQSQPAVEKEIRHFMKEMFLDTGLEEIRMSPSIIHKEVFRNSSKYDIPYLSRIIRENIKAEIYHEWSVEGLSRNYALESEAMAAAEVRHPDVHGYLLQGKIQKKYKPIRYSFPRMEEVIENGKKEIKRFEVSDLGRPFVFKRRDFVSEEEHNSTEVSAENMFITSMTDQADTSSVSAEKNPELPF